MSQTKIINHRGHREHRELWFCSVSSVHSVVNNLLSDVMRKTIISLIQISLIQNSQISLLPDLHSIRMRREPLCLGKIDDSIS